MVPLALSITDQSLLRKIQSSVLADDQKRELTVLLPQMTELERGEINQLIDDSVREIIAADPELQKRVAALNEEYNRKVQELLHQQGRMIRESFEKLDNDENVHEMESAEAALTNADSATPDSPQPFRGSARNLPRASRTQHLFLKMGLGLAFLAIVATVLILALK